MLFFPLCLRAAGRRTIELVVKYKDRSILVLYTGVPSVEDITGKITAKLKLRDSEDDVTFLVKHRSSYVDFDEDVLHVMQDHAEWEMLVQVRGAPLFSLVQSSSPVRAPSPVPSMGSDSSFLALSQRSTASDCSSLLMSQRSNVSDTSTLSMPVGASALSPGLSPVLGSSSGAGARRQRMAEKEADGWPQRMPMTFVRNEMLEQLDRGLDPNSRPVSVAINEAWFMDASKRSVKEKL